MNRIATALIATTLSLGAVSASNAAGVTYTGYTVLNNQTVTLNDPSLNVTNEVGGSGQVTLTGTNSAGGSLATWCVDILDTLQSAASFTGSATLGGTFGMNVNKLLSNVGPTLASSYDASSALQVAIWTVEYGSGLTVSAPASVLSLANSYIAHLPTWNANSGMSVMTVTGSGNQTQAYLVPVSAAATSVPEPTSLALMAGALLAVVVACRKGRGDAA